MRKLPRSMKCIRRNSANWRAVALEGLPGLFEKQDSMAELRRSHEQQRDLAVRRNWHVNHAGRLAEKKVTTLSREERVALVERAEGELPLRLQADLLSLSRSRLYYHPRQPSAEEVRLKHRIDEIYTQCPFYGSRKIAAQLQREGMAINRKTVARSMQEMGIAAIYRGPQSLVSATKGKACIRIYVATGGPPGLDSVF